MDDREWWTEADKGSGQVGFLQKGGGLLVLKNGPLCLAVYGGRDLAGLPSADSHRQPWDT